MMIATVRPRSTAPLTVVRLTLALLLFCLAVLGLVFNQAAWAQPASFLDTGPSADTLKTTFSTRLDGINEAQSTPPKNQLVVYTPGYGASTQTPPGTREVVVVGDVARQVTDHNTSIPANGWVLSGYGSGARWIERIVQRGARLGYNPSEKLISVEQTPHAYLTQIEQALERAKRHRSDNPSAQFPATLAQAQQCYSQLNQQAPALERLTTSFVSHAEACREQAEKAFYHAIDSVEQEFRGIWVRPQRQTVEAIRSQIAQFKSMGMNELFLEVYYQGKTAYPSQVMAKYELPVQHSQFENMPDPIQTWLDEAHRQGLRVHAWTQLTLAGNTQESPEQYGPILNRRPDWANRPRWAANQTTPVASSIENGHYFVDPAHPAVRQFLRELTTEVITKYPFDGVNLDYIRYPSSYKPNHPQFLSSSWGYSPTARQAFRDMISKEWEQEEQKRKEAEAQRIEELKKAGKPVPKPTPAEVKAAEARDKAFQETLKKGPPDPKDLTPSDPLWPRWVAWRKQQITSLVQDLSGTIRQQNPKLMITAVVFPPADPDLLVKLQDWPTWVERGYVDGLTPIGLNPSPEGMRAESLKLRQMAKDKVPIYVGVFGMYNRLKPFEFVEQIEAVRQAKMPGVVLFESSRLSKDYINALQQGPFRTH